ncbi:MAG: SLC13 family permease [Anaerolineae bacterium]
MPLTPTLLASAIFFVTYALIVSERVHRTISAMLGGMCMVLGGVLSQEEAFRAVDWNVIFLLLGMMAITAVLRETGLFQWVAVQAVRLGNGRPYRILAILSLITAVSSAFLDNVTIVVLVVPITLFVAANLHMDPLPFLIGEVLASNIGGTATLIGDPPNVLIASAADIDFLTFVSHMGPISVLILLAFLGLSRIMFRRELQTDADWYPDVASLDASNLITDRRTLIRSLVTMVLVIVGFLVSGFVHLEPATIAMSGATLLLFWSGIDPQRVLREIEWTTLLFFVGLFIVVQGIVRVGLISWLAQEALNLTHGNLPLTAMLILWLSAAVSGIVDNIPYTATMIPLVESLTRAIAGQPLSLWWCLALGACLGGNATLVGASANVVMASLSERSGHPIRFWRFIRYGLITTTMSLVLSSFYVWLRYL